MTLAASIAFMHCWRRVGVKACPFHYVAGYVARYVHYVWCGHAPTGTLVAESRDYHTERTLDPYVKQYYIAASASKVGIFRPKGILRLTRVEPTVIIPRGAIKNVAFDRGFSGFLWSCCQLYPLGPWNRKLSVTLDDGGGLSFWLPRLGQLARLNVAGISAVFASRDAEAIPVGAPTKSAVDSNHPGAVQEAVK